MKFPTLLSVAALFLAGSVSAVMPPAKPGKIGSCVKPGMVALTFDDGPGPYNDQLLALLKRRNVPATFFILGSKAVENPAQTLALKKIVDGGHQLASHTWDHPDLNDALSEDAMKKQMLDTDDIIFKNTELHVAYMRPPQGVCDAVCTKVMTNLGLVISDWNVDTNDWRHVNLTAPAAMELSMANVTAFINNESNPATDSYVVLQHETAKFSVDSLTDKVIDAVLAKNFTFVTMADCVGTKPAYSNRAAITPSATPSVPKGTSVSPSTSAGASASSTKGANGAASLSVSAWAFALVSAVGYAML
ncbi:chitin deacetylase [Mortierella sp. AD032]|nr:chitin deacetylase [Mortierella sp. AD032]